MSTQGEIDRLRVLVEAGYASPEEQVRLRQLEDSTRPRAPAAPLTTGTGSGLAGEDDDTVFIPLNTESFDRGGSTFFPPAKEGIYPARCTGTMTPTQMQDQLWFLFEGIAEPFQGALVTGALTAPGERSGAFKVKQILDALGVEYQVHGGSGVQFSKRALVGAPCQVEWSYIDVKGKRELRIQNAYSADQRIESL